jgi:hypothetical protein
MNYQPLNELVSERIHNANNEKSAKAIVDMRTRSYCGGVDGCVYVHESLHRIDAFISPPPAVAAAIPILKASARSLLSFPQD